MCAKFYSSRFRVPFSIFSFILPFFRTHLSYLFIFQGHIHIHIHIHELKQTENQHSTYNKLNHEQSPLVPAPEERSLEIQVFAATALEVLLKSMRGLCARRFFCG